VVYAGDALSYDFAGELVAGRERSSRRRVLVADRAEGVERLFWSRFRVPSRESLFRHADRFGSDGVAETASVYAIDMRVKRDAARPKRRRRTSASLRAEVLELRGRGVVPLAIASVLNVSDRRVREILREDGSSSVA
jgi:hypothetical protein